MFSLSARSLAGMFQAAIFSPPKIATIAGAAPGFGHVQLQCSKRSWRRLSAIPMQGYLVC